MPTIGRITVPTISPSGTFPLVPDTGYGYAIDPHISVHQFLVSGSVSAKREQRYKLGDGARRHIVRKGRICKADREAFSAFWLARGGSYQPFTFNAPNISGAGTTAVTVRFQNDPLNFEHALAMVASTGVVLVEVPTSIPSFSVTATVSRFPAGALETSLADQVQELIPLVRIRVREGAVPDIYLSNRSVTVGGNTYEPRILSWSGISQELGGAADDATFTLGNADRVFSAVADDTQLRRATVQFSFFHVATSTVINLWSGEVKDFHANQAGQFELRCADPIYEITLPYPVDQVSRTCWKPFNDGINCPWASAGSGGNPSYCDKTFDGANGCQSHGMANYFGGQAPEVQAAVIKDNGTGALRFGRSSLTATSITNQSNFGRALPEIYTDIDFETTAMVVSGREESDFYTALGIVGAGPLGAYSRDVGDLPRHTLDGQWNHGREAYLKNASKYGERFYGLRESLGQTPSTQAFAIQNTTGTPPPQRAAGTAFVELRRTDPKGVQLTRPADHEMRVWVSQGLSGWKWTTPTTPAWGVLTNPIWIATNAVLRARGYRLAASSSTSTVNAAGNALIDLPAAIAAAAVCDTSVASLVDGSMETQFKFIGVLSDEKPLKEWITEILNNCLGYFTFNFGKIRFGIRNNSITVNAFTEGNIVAGSLELSSYDPTFNHLTVQFANKDLQWSGDTVRIYDADHAAEVGGAAAPLYLKSQLNLVGTYSRSQALRLGATRLREETGGITVTERKRARGARWKTTVLALSTEPGQVVSLTHADVPGGAGEFRIIRWRLNEDMSIDIEARPTTDSMYDLTAGTVGVDVTPGAIPGSPIVVTTPGDVIPIAANPFNVSTPTLVTDSQGVQRYEIDITYNPPTWIGPFDGVSVYQERGGEILPIGDYAYNGDSTAVTPGRYGTARILIDPPAGTSPETVYLYVLGKSSTYRLPVIPRVEANPSPNRAVIIDPAELIVGTPPDAVSITSASYEYLDAYRVRVKLYWNPPAVLGYFAGVHCWEEDPDVSSAEPTPMNNTQPMDGTTNLSGEWAPIDRGRGVASPFVFESTGPSAAVTKRFYLSSYSTGAEAALVRATDASPTPSITLAIAPAAYQSGVEYAQLVTGSVVSVEYDDTQVASPKYRLRFQCAAPAIAPAAWQRGFGGYQIVYEYEDGSRVNGPSFAVNELDSKSDWYDLYSGGASIRCWFVSFDNSDTPRLNSIVDGVTPTSNAVVYSRMPGRPAEAQYADNVTDFSVFNPRYTFNGQGQKLLRIDWYWTRPGTPEAMARWGGAVMYLYLPLLTTPVQVSGAELGYYGTLEFSSFPAAPETWTFRAISQDNNGNPNADAIAPVSGTPVATILVSPPPAGAAGIEYTDAVTSPSFSVTGLTASDGTTPQRITATFTRPPDVTWGGVEMRVYAGATLVAKVSGAASPLATTIPNPTSATTYTVKLVSFDVNGQTNTETSGTPQGTVIAGSTAGTLDLTKYAPASSDEFAIVSGKIEIAAGRIGTAKISALSVTAGLLAANAVVAGKIAANAVGATEIAANSIVAGKIAANAVGATEIAANSIVAGKIAANAVGATEIAANSISSDKLNAVSILVGGGGGKPGYFEVFNAGGSSIGFIGTRSGYSGGWLKQFRAGGSSEASAPLVCDSSGNVSLNGATFTLNLNGTTTTIQNTLDSVLSEYVGLKIRLNTGGSASITPRSVSILHTDDFTGLALLTGTASGGVCKVYSVTGGKSVTLTASFPRIVLLGTYDTRIEDGYFSINSQQVVGPRGASVAAVSGTATAAYTGIEQAMLNDLKGALNTVISRLQAHGLIS